MPTPPRPSNAASRVTIRPLSPTFPPSAGPAPLWPSPRLPLHPRATNRWWPICPPMPSNPIRAGSGPTRITVGSDAISGKHEPGLAGLDLSLQPFLSEQRGKIPSPSLSRRSNSHRRGDRARDGASVVGRSGHLERLPRSMDPGSTGELQRADAGGSARLHKISRGAGQIPERPLRSRTRPASA